MQSGVPTFTLSDLARRVGGELSGDPGRILGGVASLASAGPDHLAFVARRAKRAAVDATRAGAVLAPTGFEAPPGAGFDLLEVDDPELAFATVVRLFHPRRERPAGIHHTAEIGRGARLGHGVSVDAGVVIGEGSVIGAGTRIGAATSIAAGVRVGERCAIGHAVSILGGTKIGDRVRIQPGVRLGTDGFGYAMGDGGARKIPQIGGCSIGNDVEIGANCTIDRGTLDDTVIGDRTKIDNLVHIAHNVRVGDDCFIAAHVGIAGSVEIGAAVQMGGQSGAAGHVSIGPGARIAGQSGVIGNVAAGAAYGGTPARPHSSWMKSAALTRRLPGLARRIARIERRLGVGGRGNAAGGVAGNAAGDDAGRDS